MKTSLKKSAEEDNADAKDTPVLDAEALAHLEGGCEVVESSSMTLALGNVSGEISKKDLIIPRLNIIQNTGTLADEFDHKEGGSLCYNGQTILAKAGEPINLTVLSLKKSYEEWIYPYDPDARAQVFDSERELADAGMWTDWRNNERPPARELAVALVLIEKPEGIDDLGFSHEINGKEHALAMWTLRGSGYNHGAKKMFSASSLELASSGLLSGRWELATAKETKRNNTYFVPAMRLIGKNTDEFVNAVKERLS